MTAKSCGIAVLLLILGPGLPAVLPAQVATARQGESGKPVDVVFKSPMVIELPFAQVSTLSKGDGMPFHRLEKYVCENTRVTYLLVERTRVSARKGDVYTIDGTVFVDESRDRWVSLDLQLVAAEKILAKANIDYLDAEEQKETEFQLKLQLTAQATARLMDNPELSQLKLTMRVEDNTSWDGSRPDAKKQVPAPVVAQERVLTLEKFKAVKLGFKVGRVVSLLGSDNMVVLAASRGVMNYQWMNDDGSGIRIEFVNGRVINKVQVGLD